MANVPGLRSPYARVGRLVYFGRMIDKIRLHLAGKLPGEYVDNLGENKPVFFDARTCRFLNVRHDDFIQRVKEGGTDAEILAWAEARGIPRTDEDCTIWNRFMMKIGWRDDRTEVLQQRIANSGMTGKQIETAFDFIEYDEGRDPLRTRPWELRPARVVVLMGVAGSGKTTIGFGLANALGWKFNDADDFHPPANIAKMAAGTPLDDADRAPWLAAIRAHILGCLDRDESAVVTCSALKERYRQALGVDHPQVMLVYLKGSRELLWQRINSRQGHFMKPEMLDSQLSTLEEPVTALQLDITPSPAEIVANLRGELGV